MKVYGLRIGNVGVEFSDRKDREVAIVTFTKGSSSMISDSGVKFTDSNNSFGTYERDTNEIRTTCHVCAGEFSIETCSKREYPYKYSFEKKFGTQDNYICDACFAKQKHEKEVFEAQQLLNKVSEAS